MTLNKKWRMTPVRTLVLVAATFLAGCGSAEDKAQTYYDRGTKFLAQNDHVKAGIEFKNAIQLKKDMVGAWRGLLAIEAAKGSLQGQLPLLRTIVELDPKDVSAKLRLGTFLIASNSLDQALNLANAALELNEKNPAALAFRGAVLLRMQDSAGARRDAQAALQIDPLNVEALVVLAADRVARNDLEGALLVLDREAAAHERNVAILLFKLTILDRMGDSKRIEPLLHKLVEWYPKHRAYQSALVSFYVKEKRLDDAESRLRAIADEDPADTSAGLELVRFLARYRTPDAARKELLARINTGSKAFQYQIALAEMDFSQGKQAEGIQLLEKLAKSSTSRVDVVAAQVKLAQMKFAMRNWDEADGLVSEILRNDNRNGEALKLRAQVRLQRGQLEAAITDLRQALNEDARSGELMLLLAEAYERSGSIELADKQYADATRVTNFNPSTGLRYVAFLRRRGNIERAEEILVELSQRAPNNVSVLSALADVRLARGNWIGAQAVGEKLQEVKGDTGGIADQIRAAVMSVRGRHEDSIKILEEAHEAAPSTFRSMAALVNGMMRAQQFDRAESYLNDILKQNPENAEALVLMGSVLLQKKLPGDAVKSFEKAIALQPKSVAGYLALATLHMRDRKYDEAEKVIRAGLAAQPENVALRQMFGSALEQKGDYDGAIAEFEKVFNQQPGSMIAANNLASALAEYRGDKDSLERAVTVAAVLRKSPVPQFKDTLGWIYHLRGDRRNALPLLEEAAAAMPQHALIQYHLGMGYLADGQVAKATEQFKKALALQPGDQVAAKIRAAQQKVPM